jgi:hypothetical protein
MQVIVTNQDSAFLIISYVYLKYGGKQSGIIGEAEVAQQIEQ